MGKKIKVIGAIIFYLLALGIMGRYFYVELSSRMFFEVGDRIVCLLAICLFVYLGSLLLSKYLKNNKPMKVSLWIFFVLYLCLLVTLVIFDYFRGGQISFIFTSKYAKDYLNNSFNIVPFSMIGGYFKATIYNTVNFNVIVYNLLGNVVCLMPLGFFLPRLFKRQNNFITLLMTIIGFTVAIEIGQLVTMTGSYDVDDMILNTVGAVIAFGIFNVSGVKSMLDNIFLLDNKKLNKKDIIQLLVIVVMLVIASVSFVLVNNSRSIDDSIKIEFVDESSSCDGEKEKFYESNKYIYYFNCAKSDKVYVIFNDKDKYLLKDILDNNTSGYIFDEHNLEHVDLGIIREAKMTKLIISYNVEQMYSIRKKVDDEQICDIEHDIGIIRPSGKEEQYFINGKKEGSTIFTYEVFDIETEEILYTFRYKIEVDEDLNVTYSQID